jgi:predicted DNA-binding transcriptional regulator AlpA
MSSGFVHPSSGPNGSQSSPSKSNGIDMSRITWNRPESGETVLLTAPEVGRRVGLPESWVRRHIPCRHFGRYRRWVWAEVLAWLESQK